MGTERPDEAIALCRQASQHRPAEPKYGFTLAYYLLQKGDEKDAIAALERALEQTPGHLDSVQMLGQIHERAGRKREAAALYERTLSRTGLPAEVQAALRARVEMLRNSDAR